MKGSHKNRPDYREEYYSRSYRERVVAWQHWAETQKKELREMLESVEWVGDDVLIKEILGE